MASAPATWVDLRPSNKTAAFDDRMDTSATRSDGDDLVLRFRPPSPITSVFCYGVRGSAIEFKQYNRAGDLVRTETPAVIDHKDRWAFWDYFFKPWQVATSFVFANLIPYPGGEIELTLTPAGGTASIAAVAVGRVSVLGSAQMNNGRAGLDFSRYDRNEFGEAEVVKRNVAATRAYRAFCKPNEVDAAEVAMRNAGGRRAVFLPSDDLPSLAIYGFARDWTIDDMVWWDDKGQRRGGYAFLEFDVEGLI